jgi:hypothetical protein
MRIPSIGASKRAGSQARLWAKFNVPPIFGDGSYFILEFDHTDTALAVYVEFDGEIQMPMHITLKACTWDECGDDTVTMVLIDGNPAYFQENYQTELLTELPIRLAMEKAEEQEAMAMAVLKEE